MAKRQDRTETRRPSRPIAANALRPHPSRVAKNARVDALVVGGGIVGAAVAREAALRGWSVLLVERDDLAAAASSRSTKLLHGGLRYLERGDLRLVREALREREITARLAPHLAPPLEFVLPTRRGVWPGPRAARLGVALYDWLAGPSPLPRGHRIGAAETADLVRSGEAAGWSGGVLFADRQTDDARLTVAIARAAAARGAAIRTRAELVSWLDRGGSVDGARILDRETGETYEVQASVSINAAGPWADSVRALAGAGDAALRPSRGTHLVLPDLRLRRAVLFAGRRPGHRLFAIPWRGSTLFGTTDVEADAAAPVEPAADEIRLLFEEAARLFPGAGLVPAAVAHAFAGLRPLVRGSGDTLALSREHRVCVERGLVSILGGKLTTWRSIGEDAARVAARRLGWAPSRHPASATERLPGGDPAPAADDPRFRAIDPGTARRWIERYGSESVDLAERVRDDPASRERLVPDHPARIAEVDFAVEREFARGLEDVLARRLGLEQDPDVLERAAAPAARRMRALLGWSAERESREIAGIRDGIAAVRERIAAALTTP